MIDRQILESAYDLANQKQQIVYINLTDRKFNLDPSGHYDGWVYAHGVYFDKEARVYGDLTK